MQPLSASGGCDIIAAERTIARERGRHATPGGPGGLADVAKLPY